MDEFEKALDQYIDNQDEKVITNRFAQMEKIADGNILTAITIAYGQGLKYGSRWAREWIENSVNGYHSDEYVQQVGSWKINQRLECQVSELRTSNAKLREALENIIAPCEMYQAYGWSDRSNVIGKAKQALKETGGE